MQIAKGKDNADYVFPMSFPHHFFLDLSGKHHYVKDRCEGEFIRAQEKTNAVLKECDRSCDLSVAIILFHAGCKTLVENIASLQRLNLMIIKRNLDKHAGSIGAKVPLKTTVSFP